MTYEVRGMIPRDHPALAGHFPGNPVVPGVLILEAVTIALQVWRSERVLREIRSARFTTPLAPGREFVIRLREADDSHIVFECLQDDRALASGELVLDPPGPRV